MKVEIKGLKMMRKNPNGKLVPCGNCGCQRYGDCGCLKSKKKE